jgi:hypothetical protein
MFELLFHIELITSIGLLFKNNDRLFLNNISCLSINILFQIALISEEVAYEIN